MMEMLLDRARKRLHAQGGRMTAQRQLILETLEDHSGHPTAEEIYQLAREQDPSLHLSTVYRTLRWLEQEGLVKPRLFKDDRLQERFDPVHPTDHHHFVCLGCKKVIEFDNRLLESIKASFAKENGSRVDSAALVLYGLCSSCNE